MPGKNKPTRVLADTDISFKKTQILAWYIGLSLIFYFYFFFCLHLFSLFNTTEGVSTFYEIDAYFNLAAKYFNI